MRNGDTVVPPQDGAARRTSRNVELTEMMPPNERIAGWRFPAGFDRSTMGNDCISERLSLPGRVPGGHTLPNGRTTPEPEQSHRQGCPRFYPMPGGLDRGQPSEPPEDRNRNRETRPASPTAGRSPWGLRRSRGRPAFPAGTEIDSHAHGLRTACMGRRARRMVRSRGRSFPDPCFLSDPSFVCRVDPCLNRTPPRENARGVHFWGCRPRRRGPWDRRRRWHRPGGRTTCRSSTATST